MCFIKVVANASSLGERGRRWPAVAARAGLRREPASEFPFFPSFCHNCGSMSISDSIPSGELRWYSVNEVAAHLGVAADTVYRWIESKGLPAHRLQVVPIHRAVYIAPQLSHLA